MGDRDPARLKGERLRYGELRKAIPDLADKVLTQRLRSLEEAGLLTRDERDGIVAYALDPFGASLSPALEQLYAGGEVHGGEAGVRFRPGLRNPDQGAAASAGVVSRGARA